MEGRPNRAARRDHYDGRRGSRGGRGPGDVAERSVDSIDNGSSMSAGHCGRGSRRVRVSVMAAAWDASRSGGTRMRTQGFGHGTVHPRAHAERA